MARGRTAVPPRAAASDAATHYRGEAWNAAAVLLGTFTMLEQLPSIDIPTLCLTGRHDFITPPEPGAERLASMLPNAELTVFEDSGHYPFLEEEADFFARVRAFLA